MRFPGALTALVSLSGVEQVASFAGLAPPRALMASGSFLSPRSEKQHRCVIRTAAASDDDDKVLAETDEALNAIKFSSDAEKKEAVGNLLADDEWLGLTMELSETIRLAVLEDFKKNAREFLGKDEYKLGDISKEIDTRVKEGVAGLRGKKDYELGDFVLAMDEMAKSMTEDLTGKDYEPGDLSIELDKRIKKSVSDWVGKDEYEFGDLSREISKRVKSRVEGFTGKPYEFGDVSREIENKRREWMKNTLGEEAAENYVFGDVTKKFISNWTGKDEYEFGDVTKKLLGNLFGGRKKKSG